MPEVSICIPAYRAERYLPETLESVRDQSFSDWELIVVEDGSQDGSEEMVRQFARDVPQKVTFQRHSQNRGLPATRNTAIAQASAKLIALLDADDYWEPDHLETIVATLRKSGADLAHSGSVLFDSDSRRILETRAPSPDQVRDFPRSLFVADYIIQPASVILTKELWKRVGGFNESYRYVEDREMWLRCARSGARFHFTEKNTCFYRKHATALSTHGAEMAIASARVFEQHLDWPEIPKDMRVSNASNAWVAAARILQRAEPRRASELLLRAQRIAPSFSRLLWVGALRLYSFPKGK